MLQTCNFRSILYLSLLNHQYLVDCKECLKDKFADFQPALYFYNVHYFFMHSDLPVYLSDKVRWMAHNAKSLKALGLLLKLQIVFIHFSIPTYTVRLNPVKHGC